MQGRAGSLVEVFAAGSRPARMNIGLGRGLELLLLEDSEIEEKSARGGGGKEEIVGRAGMSVSSDEMWEVFSAVIDVMAFMLETPSSASNTREGTSLARGRP